MALVALFSKMALGPNEEDEEEQALSPSNRRDIPTLAFASVSKYDSTNSLPPAKRNAFLAARNTKSINHIANGSQGPGHYRLEKKGTGRKFDIVLGNPCTCRDHATRCDVESNTSLQLIYYVLIRLLLVEESDDAIALAPNLPNGVVDRIIDQSIASRQRAIRVENKSKRSSYETDNGTGSEGDGFLLSMGIGVDELLSELPKDGFRVHPRLKRFDGLPPVLLGEQGGAVTSLGNAMAGVDTVGQVESLWSSTLEKGKTRKRLHTEPFGQEFTLPNSLVAIEKKQVDPHWDFAKTHASSSFPWRRELNLSEKVALLSKDGTGNDVVPISEGAYSPVRKRGLGSRATTRPGIDSSTGRPSTLLAEMPKYPYNTAGGRVVVDKGTVLPPGMGIRHPALTRASRFKRDILEFLSLWSLSSEPITKLALGQKVDTLWAKHTRFRAWARMVYRANRSRVQQMRAHPIRITVHLPDKRGLGLTISPLATGLDMRKLLAYKLRNSRLVTNNGVRSLKSMTLVFEGVPIDERVSLYDSGVRERSTLTLTRLPAQLMNGDDGLPVY